MGKLCAGICAAMIGFLLAPPAHAEETGAMRHVETDIDRLIDGLSARLDGLPGIAVAIYTPDGAYATSYGAADSRTNDANTADTSFYIASTTKAFTALTMNILHHRGEIDLDATITEFAPDAPFPDAVNPGDVRLRELLTHTMGFDNRPIAFRSAFTGEHSPELLWDLLATSKVRDAAPRGTYSYTNGGYNILTVLTDHMLGVPWQDLLAEEIFNPAGMTRTSAYMSKAAREGWHMAKPHNMMSAGGAEPIDLMKTDSMMQSAGGMIMSANDALLWLELLVNDGRINGQQIVPAKAVRETRERLAHVGLDRSAFTGQDFTRQDYGLGWNIGDYKGDTILHHGGGFAGFSSIISYMPERKIGVAVFANASGVGAIFPPAIASFVYDRILGSNEPQDVTSDVAEFMDQFDGIMERLRADLENRAGRKWNLSQPKSAYVGTYHSDQIGTLVIAKVGDGLHAKLGPLQSEIEPFTRPDTMRVAFAGAGSVVSFDVTSDGRVDSATLFDAEFNRH